MGRSNKTRKCSRCGSRNVLLQDTFGDGVSLYVCADCEHEFEVDGSRAKRRDYYQDNNEYSDYEQTKKRRERRS